MRHLWNLGWGGRWAGESLGDSGGVGPGGGGEGAGGGSAGGWENIHGLRELGRWEEGNGVVWCGFTEYGWTFTKWMGKGWNFLKSRILREVGRDGLEFSGLRFRRENGLNL